MIHASKIGLRTKLIQSLNASDTVMRIPPTEVPRWRPVLGDQQGAYWAIIDDGVKREIVMILGTTSGGLDIRRAQDSTNAANFPAGTCVKVDWNESAMLEFLGEIGLPAPVMQPGVYCLTCASCITVDGQGRITKIDGVEKC